jgi:hypothetical protein
VKFVSCDNLLVQSQVCGSLNASKLCIDDDQELTPHRRDVIVLFAAVTVLSPLSREHA